IIIEDVLLDPAFAPHRASAASAGFRAVQSTPLFSRSGEPLGMISTHFRQPHRPSERELRITDLYARQAAEVIERKRIEEALRESEERFSTVANSAPVMIWITSRRGNEFVNRAFFEFVGVEDAVDVQGDKWAQFIHPDDRDAYVAAYFDCFARQAPFEGSMRVRRHDGAWRWMKTIGQPRFTAAGEFLGYIGSTLDITDIIEAQTQLRQSQERFAIIFQASPVAIAISTLPDGRFLDVNESYLQLIGHRREEVIGRTSTEVGIWANVDDRQRLVQMLGQQGLHNIEGRFRTQSGEIRHSLISAETIELGGEPCVLSLVQDITDRKRAEEELRRSEATLAEGQRLSHTASWRWNVSTGEVYWSAELYRIYGLDPEKTKPGYPDVLNYIHPEDRARVEKTFEDAVREEREYELAYRVVWSDGTIRHVNNLAHPVFSKAGTLVEYVGTTIDTTQRVHAEEALQKLQTELAHVTRVTTMGELAASIAHEINQPLGAIVNNSNVLLRLVDADTGLPDELREILSDIVQDANRISAIVAHIRRMTTRTLPEKTSLQLGDVIAGVLALAHRELAGRGIQVVTDLSEDLPRVSGDRVQLQQVLLNLVMNSIEAMSDVDDTRRVLTIGGQRDELDGQPAVRLTVRDLGSGFRPEDSERLFEAFYSTKPHGMGMGLRISRSIVEAHGGRLWAELNAGPGMTFSCALPAQNPDAS
ncbi:MAG: hypothetical protein QOK44_5359, partial [Betaproteobacteria bacterium]|nr:hypothetical protein [Betaproteobacteria bacterium]